MGIDPGVSHLGGERVSHNTTDARHVGLTILGSEEITIKGYTNPCMPACLYLCMHAFCILHFVYVRMTVRAHLTRN